MGTKPKPAATTSTQRASGTFRRNDGERLVMDLHDFGEPLYVCRLALRELARVVEQDSDSNRAGELINRLNGALDRMAGLIDDLMELSRGAEQSSPATTVDLCKLAHDVCASRRTSDGPPITFHADATVLGRWSELRLWQILANLLGNALKHGRGTPVEVRVWRDEFWAYVSVSDNGPGISDEQRAAIFTRGFRADEGVPGYGLGLWIARQASRDLGGDLVLSAASGGGASFLLTLPLR